MSLSVRSSCPTVNSSSQQNTPPPEPSFQRPRHYSDLAAGAVVGGLIASAATAVACFPVEREPSAIEYQRMMWMEIIAPLWSPMHNESCLFLSSPRVWVPIAVGGAVIAAYVRPSTWTKVALVGGAVALAATAWIANGVTEASYIQQWS